MDALNRPRALSAAELCRGCDPAQFPFATTEELEDYSEPLGQARAVEAIRFGVGIRRDGFNLYAMGPEGVGRHTIVRRLLEGEAGGAPVPSEWCYVFNFDAPHRPRALELPAGRASQLMGDMARLVEDLRTGIAAAFETDEYRTRRKEIESDFEERQEQAINAIGEKARGQGVALLRTPAGFAFAPFAKGEVLKPEEFHRLPEEERARIEQSIVALQGELERVIHEVPKWRREAQRKLRELNRLVARTAINSLIEDLKQEYADLPEVVAHLARVQEDVLDHAHYFQQPKEGEQPPTLFGIPLPQLEPGESPLGRYQVNVLVECAGARGAPVVYEDNPTHQNLVGRIEHMAQMGTLVTDFTRIRAGALHRANGGYLILDALKVLTHPFAWDALKRALRSREIRIESLAQTFGLISTVSLEPEPVPLDVKVVLVGERLFYYLLHGYDPEFGELFKVAADFEDEMDRAPETDLLCARMIAAIARREKLRPLDRGAVARVIEEASRSVSDAEKLSTRIEGMADLLREADHWAGVAGRAVATAEDVRRAVEAAERRSSRVRERLREEVLRGTLLVDTQGERVGQVNGLAVMQLGGFAFGHPQRITARVRLGGGKVVDIERESELGGPIHSKGVLILSGYLSGRYAARMPLQLSASLVFEQSYGGVEGDSASSAELYALLSALAGAPVRQSLAVTGSVNQHGDVQAIGGVNEKIEGFFEVCKARGLNGEHGVLIPAANVKHLMLRREVVEAVAAGKFAVYPVATVDEGIEILTGTPAEAINRQVEQRLADFAERARRFGAPAEKGTRWRARGPR
jgi:lon-related putative ATP-dependent protease